MIKSHLIFDCEDTLLHYPCYPSYHHESLMGSLTQDWLHVVQAIIVFEFTVSDAQNAL